MKNPKSRKATSANRGSLAKAQLFSRFHLRGRRSFAILIGLATVSACTPSVNIQQRNAALDATSGKYAVTNGREESIPRYENGMAFCRGTTESESEYAQCMQDLPNNRYYQSLMAYSRSHPRQNRSTPATIAPSPDYSSHVVTPISPVVSTDPSYLQSLLQGLSDARYADHDGKFSQAFALYMQLVTAEEVILPRLPPNLAEVHLGVLQAAEYEIGLHYERGVAVAQDFYAAVTWYEKANAATSYAYPIERLGFLYANGLGVPRDREKARALFRSLGTSGSIYYAALDYNMLPRTLDDWTPATTQAVKERDDKEKAARTARIAAGLAAVLSAPRTQSQPQDSSPGWFACHHIYGAMGGIAGCPPW